MRKDRHIVPIQNVHSQAIPSLHQCIQILSRWMDFHPSRVVVRRRRLETVHQRQLPGRSVLAMRPDLVGLQVGRVQESLGGIEDHAVDTGVFDIFVVLHVLRQAAVVLYREDVAVAGVFVEWVAVDVVRRLFGGEHEDGSSVGVCTSSQRVTGHRVRDLVDNVRRAVDGERIPFLHRRAIDGFFVVLVTLAPCMHHYPNTNIQKRSSMKSPHPQEYRSS